MENKTSNNVGIFIFIIIFGIAFLDALGFIGIVIAFILMTSYVNNFVLKPLSKKLSLKHYTPSNYMYRKLQNTRLVIWIISAMLGFPLIFIVEMIAIAISVAKINEIKKELGIPIKNFSKHDYLIYEEYSKFSEEDEYNEHEGEKSDDDYTERREYTYDDVVENQDVKVNVVEDVEDREEQLKKEIEEKFDFNKPIGDMPSVEPIKTNTSSIWDAPISDNEEKSEQGEDEIRCEKCGTIMSKMKIACPKCGALVMNSYRSGK